MTIEKLESRIEELKSENVKDQEQLTKLEYSYEAAVNKFDTTKIDKLHGEIEGIKLALVNRENQISLLINPDNPVRVQAREQALLSVETELNEIKAKADALKAELLKAQAAYIELANEVFAVNREYGQAERKYNSAIGKEYYLNPYLDSGSFTVNIGASRTDADPRKKQTYHYKGGK